MSDIQHQPTASGHTAGRASSKRLRAACLVGAFVVAFAMALAGAAAPALAEELNGNSSELIARLLPSVVNVTARKEVAQDTRSTNAAASGGNAKTFVGSGFVIDAAGLIVTNYH